MYPDTVKEWPLFLLCQSHGQSSAASMEPATHSERCGIFPQHPRLIPVFNWQSGSNKILFFHYLYVTLPKPRIPTLCASSEHLKKINQTINLFTIKSVVLFIHIDHSFTYIVAWNRDLQQTTTPVKVILLYHNRHRSSYCTAPRLSCQGGVRPCITRYPLCWLLLFSRYQYIMQNYRFAFSFLHLHADQELYIL